MIATADDIGAAYRLLLGRNADADGLAHYTARVAAGALTVQQLREEISHSAEYFDRQLGKLIVVDMDGLRVVVDPAEPEFGRHITEHRTWEPHIVAQIVQQLQPGDTFVDIGANVGIMSFHAARAVGETGKVIGFEPNVDNAQNFLRGVTLNGFGNVHLYPFGASSHHQIFALRGSSNTHLVDAGEPGMLTQAFRADDFLRNETRVDLIKIDIEGHEPHALLGLAETLRRFRPTLLCEFNPRCLRDHIGQDTSAFAHDLFTLFQDIEVIESDGGKTAVTSADALMALWQERNRIAVDRGHLPDGMLHFDLLLATR